MTTKFERVKAGLEASVAVRAEAAKEEKQRWKTVFANIPVERQKMATILLGNPRTRHMTTAEIITACNVGMAPEGDTSTGKQQLFAQGMTDAAALLGKPAPVIHEAYPATSREPHIDPALYAAGEAMATALKPFMMNAR